MVKVLGFQNVRDAQRVAFKVLALCMTSIPTATTLGHASGILTGVLGVAQQQGATSAVWLWDVRLSSLVCHVRKPQRSQLPGVVGRCVSTPGFLCGLHKALEWREEGGVGRLGWDRRRGGAPRVGELRARRSRVSVRG